MSNDDKILKKLDELIADVKAMKETLDSHSRTLRDYEDFKRDFKLSVQDFPGAAGYRPAEPRRGYPGGALIERDEDMEELGLHY